MARILIVEDNPALCADLVEFLEAKGYDARGVANAGALLDISGSEHFDGVILDIALPDGDGMQSIPVLRRQYGFDCGILMLTSFDERGKRIESLNMGADAYLVKSASLGEIEATLRSILRRVLPSEGAVTVSKKVAGAGWVLHVGQWMLQPPDGTGIPLTGAEMSFLKQLAGQAVCSRDDILQSFSNSVRQGGANLDAIARRLRSKISEHTGQPAPIKSVYGVGFSFTDRLTPTP